MATDPPPRSMSLLHDPLVAVLRGGGRSERCTLPEVFEHLWADDDLRFPSLRAHQEQSWFCFIVQLAAMIAEARDGVLPRSASDWRACLLELSEGSEEAWCLIVDDPSKPAFMQAPTPPGATVPAKEVSTPDALDYLTVPKNHDVKSSRLAGTDVDAWLYALISLQTMSGYSGAGKHGIARMNGGSSSRPLVARYADPRFACRVREDVAFLAAWAPEARTRCAPQNGARLLWLDPWDGTSQLDPTAMHPYAIEICRRVRLRRLGAGIVGYDTTTKAARVNAKDLHGDLGDPWVPLKQRDGAALTISEQGFNAARMLNLLSGEGELRTSPAANHPKRAPGQWLLAVAVARGQGKTLGLHERWLEIPKRKLSLLAAPDSRMRVANTGLSMLEELGQVSKALSAACFKLLSGDQARGDLTPYHWVDSLRAEADAAFFAFLWKRLDDDDELTWPRHVVGEANRILARACEEAPIPNNRRLRSIVAAEGIFRSKVHKHFPNLYEEQSDERHAS